MGHVSFLGFCLLMLECCVLFLSYSQGSPHASCIPEVALAQMAPKMWPPEWYFGKRPLGVEQEQTGFSVKLSVAFLTTSTVCLDFLAKHKVTPETENGEDPHVTEEMRYRQWPCTDYGSQASQEGSGPVLSSCSGLHCSTCSAP